MNEAGLDQDYQAGPASLALARLGADVGARLDAAPGVQRVDIEDIALFVQYDFLSPAECARLMAMIDADSQPSDLFSEGDDNGFRTSYSCNLDRWDEFVLTIDTRICTLLGIPPENGETLQGQRYRVGEEFKPHHDFFHVDQPYWPEMEATGGQRSWTVMIYLNEPEAGGETGFPAISIAVSPRAGMLLAWNNMRADGAPNMNTLHTGQSVSAGTKYIVTKWFRERSWL